MEEMLEWAQSGMSDTEALEAKQLASKLPENDEAWLRALVFRLENNPSPEVKKRLGRQR